MSKLDLPKLYATQISQSEWFHAISHAQSDAFRKEDNEKRTRLGRLNELIGLPFDRAVEFPATDVASPSVAFNQFLAERAGQYCALRLVPYDHKLPKIRTRGVTVEQALAWFKDQDIDPANYRADFMPHSNNQEWSTVFVVNDSGVFGEIVAGSHTQLTQGFYEDQPPMRFSWDFKTLSLEPGNDKAAAHLKVILDWLHIDDPEVRQTLKDEYGSKFHDSYLEGYFETTSCPEYGLWFVDYNRILGQLYESFRPQQKSTGPALVSGQSSSTGIATGRVRLVEDPADSSFQDSEVLVCSMTTPAFVPLMRRASAIVTDLGGILSHAAIVARELGKPCLTATGNATTVLKTGQLVEVNADMGVVKAAD